MLRHDIPSLERKSPYFCLDCIHEVKIFLFLLGRQLEDSGVLMSHFGHAAIRGASTCPWFVQMVPLLHMHGNVNLLARLVHLLLIGPGMS